ncbi:MAG: hypothetical protein ACRDDY_17715 [Clostridium sp.]|uniref:hypothetical protein n=1 Tax=Clostridium sp. TaxID=1506 RepID=UPI003EE62B35
MIKSKNMIVINSNSLQLIGEYELYTSSISGETYEVVKSVQLVDNKGTVKYQSGNNLHMSIENIEIIEDQIIVALENNLIDMLDKLCYKCNWNYFQTCIKQYVNRMNEEKRSEFLSEINEENKTLKNEVYNLATMKDVIILDMLDSIELYEKLDNKVTQELLNYRTYSDSKKELCNQLVNEGYIKLISIIKNDDTIYNTYNEIRNNNYKDAIKMLA